MKCRLLNSVASVHCTHTSQFSFIYNFCIQTRTCSHSTSFLKLAGSDFFVFVLSTRKHEKTMKKYQLFPDTRRENAQEKYPDRKCVFLPLRSNWNRTPNFLTKLFYLPTCTYYFIFLEWVIREFGEMHAMAYTHKAFCLKNHKLSLSTCICVSFKSTFFLWKLMEVSTTWHLCLLHFLRESVLSIRENPIETWRKVWSRAERASAFKIEII